MVEGTPRPGGRPGIVTTLICKAFKLKELDKRIEKTECAFAALDRSLDRLPPGSIVTIRDQDVQIGVWKAGQKPAFLLRPADAAAVTVMPGNDAASPRPVIERPRVGSFPFEAG